MLVGANRKVVPTSREGVLETAIETKDGARDISKSVGQMAERSQSLFKYGLPFN